MSRVRSTALSPVGFKALVVGVLLLSLPLLYLGFSTLMSGITGHQAQLFLDDWGQKRTEPSEKAWQFAMDAAQRSLDWTPGAGAEQQDRLGRIAQWYLRGRPFGDVEAEPARRQALDAFRRSVEARPLWPYTRIQLLYAKLRLLEFDEEFHEQLAQARRLAPGRTRVHGPLAELGMIAWPQLNDQQKAETWQSLELVLRYEPRRAKSLYALAERAGLIEPLCAALSPELLQQRKWCQSVNKS